MIEREKSRGTAAKAAQILIDENKGKYMKHIGKLYTIHAIHKPMVPIPRLIRFLGLFLLAAGLPTALPAKTIVVDRQAVGANDRNPGTAASPLKTIQAGANLAQPGDTILVKAGIYREEVKPPRGGTSAKQPIVYLAAPGEVVSVRGSEQITNWVSQGDGVWMVELADSFFNGYNPFTVLVRGAWLHGDPKYHLGDVYLNSEAYREKFTLLEVQSQANTWYTVTTGGKTQIWANFGAVNPNTTLTEINARATGFFPDITGLKYIVIDGFDIRHHAPQWVDHFELEKGSIGTRLGYGWIIQNCAIANSRNTGISLGVTKETPFDWNAGNFPAMETIGHHIIRNNVIKRCGQLGIYGIYGAVATLIEGNVISETNYRNEWNGANTGDIKILFFIDGILRNNLCYGVPGLNNVHGIWLDWGAQNARVTGNLIVDHNNIDARGLDLEIDNGPTVVDNNVLINSTVCSSSNGAIFVHNLFSNYTITMGKDGRDFSPYYFPHSTKLAGTTATRNLHNRWYNNIFIGGNAVRYMQMDFVGKADIIADYNVYLDAAHPFSPVDTQFTGEGKNSFVDPTKTGLQFQFKGDTALLKFTFQNSALQMTNPLITSQSIGKVPLTNMFMEEPDGTPRNITSDYYGNPITPDMAIHPYGVVAGPFQRILPGLNRFVVWPKSKAL